MPPKPRKSGDDEYIPSDSEDSDSPTEQSSRPLRGRSKEKSTESLSVHSGTSQRSHHSKKSASRTSSYVTSSAHSSRTSSKGRSNVGTKVARKTTRRKTIRRKNTLVVSKTSTTEGEAKKKMIPKIVVRNPTHKVVKIPKKNMDTKMLAPPPTKRKKTKKKKDVKVVEATSDDEILASLPLPSSSIPHVYNTHISMIGSINIQAFGIKKWSNHVIMRIIADILRRYDIVLCQEVHIPKGKEEILQELADLVSTPATPYSYVSSDPIGRNSYQERYLYLYRKNEWEVLDSYVFDDDEKLGDKFLREPYVVRFQHLRKPNVRVTLVGCHTQPENAFDEIKVLVSDVYVNVKNKLHRDTVQEKRQHRSVQERAEKEKKTGCTAWIFSCFSHIRSYCLCYYCLCLCLCPSFMRRPSAPTRESKEDIDELSPLTGGRSDEPIVMMGDFNAAGSYVNKKQRAELDQILQKNKLMWGILHSSDTTVADGSNAAYDRFVFEAANERKWIGNTRVWRFDEGWESQSTDKPSIKKAAKRVTDHYPIEFELKI